MLDHDTLVRSAAKLQPLPQSCTRLAALLTDEDSDVKEMTEVLSLDPVLTGKLLRMANSAAYAARQPITNVKQAVIRLGGGTVLRLAVAACAQPLMEQAVAGYGLSPRQLWQHSVTAALAAEEARAFCSTPLSPLSFTAALLHDLGKLVLGPLLTPALVADCQRAAAEGGLLPYQAEAEILSLHHGEVGGLVAQHWKLPAGIVLGVTHHHTPAEGEDLHAFVTYLVNIVARRLEGTATLSDLEHATLDATRERLGVTEAGFERICERTSARLGEVRRQYS